MKNKKLIFLVEGKTDVLFLQAICNRLKLNKDHYKIDEVKNKEGISTIPSRLLNNLSTYDDYVIIIDSDNNLQNNLTMLDKEFKKKYINLNLTNELQNKHSKHKITFIHNEEIRNINFFAFHDNTNSNPCKGTYESLLFKSINDNNEYKKLVINTFEKVNKIYDNLQSEINDDLTSKINNINNIYKRKLSIYLSLHHKCYETATNAIHNPFYIYEDPEKFGAVYEEIFAPLKEYETFIKTSYNNFLNP